MAIITLGPTVVGIRGTLGGIVFSTNKAGNYARQWSLSSSPKTESQTTQRGLLSQQPEAWRALSSAQQALWDAFAALPAQDQTNPLGVTYSLSGFGWFVKINTRLLRAGRVTRTAPPVLARPANPTISGMNVRSTAGALGSNISYPAGTFAGFDMILQMQLNNAKGRTVPNESGMVQVLNQTVAASAQSITSHLAAAFGIITIGQFAYAFAYRQTIDGLRSAPTTTSDFVQN